MQKLCTLIAAAGFASSACAIPASAEVITTDAGLAGKRFCWSGGADSETYNRDHTYVYIYMATVTAQAPTTVKGTWAISKDGTITLKLNGGGTAVRRYDAIDADHLKELTGTLLNWWGGPGKRC